MKELCILKRGEVMITSLTIFAIFSILFLRKRKIAVNALNNLTTLKRIERKKRIKRINRKTILNIFGYSIASILLVLSIFFLYCYFYFPIEYRITSDSKQEIIPLSGVQYNDDLLFYVAQDTIDGEDKYYYFTIKDNDRWMETLDIEKVTLETIGINDSPVVEKKTIVYSVVPTYRNKILSFIIHDFCFDKLDYFKFKEEDISQENIQEEQYIVKIPQKDIPKIDIRTLHFKYKR